VLFGDFAVPDEATVILPRAVKVPRRDDEAPEDTGYRIEPGDLSFDAAPADLYRRLRPPSPTNVTGGEGDEVG